MKLETYLRMAKSPFVSVPGLDLRRAPKGKLPWIEDGATVMGDSNLIIDYLESTYGSPLDGWLDPEQQAVALAFRRLIEENLYWAVLHGRWIEPAGWALTREAFFSRLPFPLGLLVPVVARRGLAREMWGQGMGRHSRDEIIAIGKADLTAVARFLGDKPYIMGERPSVLDAVAYASLANVLWVPIDSPLKSHLAGFPAVDAYCRRMKAEFYGP